MDKSKVRGVCTSGTVVGIMTLVIVLLIGGSAAIIPASDIAVNNITPPSIIAVPRYTVSVSTSPPGLKPQPTGGGTYDNGTTATVTAQLIPGYMFQRWIEYVGDIEFPVKSIVSTSSSYSFSVTGNRDLIAEYLPAYTVSVSTSPSSLNPQPTGAGTYPEGQIITVTAQFVTGYTFQGWTEHRERFSTDYSYSFNVTGERSLVAEYSQNQYNISVSTSPPGLNPQPTGGGIYYFNDTATVTAQTVTGYTFQRWTENGTLVSTDASYKFTVTGDRNLVAEYLRSPYNISVSTSPSGLDPQPTGGGTYSYNDTAKVIAQPATGYTFQRWTENGNPVSTDASYSFNVTGNRTLMAEYSKNTYTVSVKTSPVGLDSQPEGGGNYSFEDAVTVTAQPVAGYKFQRWTENGKQVSTNLKYSFKANGNRNLVAEYSKAAGPSITIEPSPGVKGTEMTPGETKNSSVPATNSDVKPPILGLIIAIFAIIAAAGILKYLVIGAPKLKVDIEKLLQMNIETSGGEVLDKPELRQYKKVDVDVKGGIEKL